MLTLEHCVHLEAESLGQGFPSLEAPGSSQGQGDFLLTCSPTFFPFLFLIDN